MLLFNIIEVIFIFNGESIFLNKLNLVSIFLHAVATVILSTFILDAYPSNYLWKIFIVGCLIPVFLEICAICYTRSVSKSAKSYKN